MTKTLLKISALFIILSISDNSYSQESIKWMTMTEALKANKKNKKKIIIDFYTDWCGWCKRMDKDTYDNPAVARYINKNFYPVKFNAEKEANLKFRDKDYALIPSGRGKVHELAVELIGPRLGYPATAFLDEDLNKIQTIPGYIKAVEFETIINYFNQNLHKSTQYEDFKKIFKSQN